MATYFTADTHFGDAHILRQRGTVFASLDDHDAGLIARWNAVVTETDEVWHLGDFAAGASRARCAEIFAALNGRKRLIRGNHDTNRVLDLPWVEPPRESARISARDESTGAECRLFLAHYAHRAWPGLWRGTRHLYGHTHGSLPDTRLSCDVGADAWDYRPVGVAALMARQNRARAVPEELQRVTDPHVGTEGPGDGGLAPEIAPAAEPRTFSLMITQRQRMQLRERGFSDQSIRLMTPAEAHARLGLKA